MTQYTGKSKHRAYGRMTVNLIYHLLAKMQTKGRQAARKGRDEGRKYNDKNRVITYLCLSTMTIFLQRPYWKTNDEQMMDERNKSHKYQYGWWMSMSARGHTPNSMKSTLRKIEMAHFLSRVVSKLLIWRRVYIRKNPPISSSERLKFFDDIAHAYDTHSPLRIRSIIAILIFEI